MTQAQKDAVLNMKPSAYRSMMMGKLGLSKSTPAKEKALIDWKNERWINLTALITDSEILPCGKKGKKQIEMNLPSTCRPSKKVSEKTPKPLVKDLSVEQIIKAIKIKQTNKQIDWSKL